MSENTQYRPLVKRHKPSPQFCTVTVGQDQLPVNADFQVSWPWERTQPLVPRLYCKPVEVHNPLLAQWPVLPVK